MGESENYSIPIENNTFRFPEKAALRKTLGEFYDSIKRTPDQAVISKFLDNLYDNNQPNSNTFGQIIFALKKTLLAEEKNTRRYACYITDAAEIISGIDFRHNDGSDNQIISDEQKQHIFDNLGEQLGYRRQLLSSSIPQADVA